MLLEHGGKKYIFLPDERRIVGEHVQNLSAVDYYKKELGFETDEEAREHIKLVVEQQTAAGFKDAYFSGDFIEYKPVEKKLAEAIVRNYMKRLRRK